MTRTTSRARPARRSSWVSSRSRATVSAPPLATAHPDRGVSVTATSSGSISTSAPSTITRAWPARSAATNVAGSALVIADATTWVRLPNRLPSARKFGLTLSCTSSPVPASVDSSPTLSSSATSRRSASGISDQPGAEISAGRSAEFDQPAHLGHLRAESGVHPPWIRRRPGLEVDGVHPVAVREQRRPHLVRDERRERRHQQREQPKTLVQGGERGRVAVPEAAPRPTHVPVRQVVDVPGDRAAGTLRVEVLERRIDLQGEPVRLGQRPPVEQRALAGRTARTPVVRTRVERLERGHRPIRPDDLGRDLVEDLVPDPSRRPR